MDDGCRDRARLLLQAFVLAATHGGFELPVRMDLACVLKPWPLEVAGANQVRIAFLSDGRFELQPGMGELASDAWQAWFVKLGVTGQTPKDTLGCLQLWVADKSGRGIAKQVVHGLAKRLDDSLTDGGAGAAILEPCDDAAGRLTDFAMEAKLSRYRKQCIAACSPMPRCMSFACDESRVGSLGIQNAVAVKSDNTCMLLPPTVVLKGGYTLAKTIMGPPQPSPPAFGVWALRVKFRCAHRWPKRNHHTTWGCGITLLRV